MRQGILMNRSPREDITLSTLSDSLPIAVLIQLLTPASPSSQPPLPLFRVRNSGEAYQFASACFDSRRSRQLVVMTKPTGRGWIVDPRSVAQAVGVDADVVMIDDGNTLTAVNDALTKKLGVYSGRVRVLRPGLTLDDEEDRHPLILVGEQTAEDTLIEIELYVEDGTRLRREAHPADRFEAAVAEAVRHAVADTERRERARTAEETARATTLKRALLKAEAALAEEQRPLFADPHAQFRYELHHAWLHATEEGDRQSWPLREWELGPEFLASIDAQQIVDRARVIRACVDVITGRHAEINSRASHQFRPAGGNARRRDDGSIAWRCSINMGPSAARLMWWERADGIVEPSLVAAHDDFRII